MPANRSSGRHSGPKYRERFLEGFVASSTTVQPYGFTESVWGPLDVDPVTVTFPTIAIKNAHPQLGKGPVTAQYPDLSGPGTIGSNGEGYVLAFRAHNGDYVPIGFPADREA